MNVFADGYENHLKQPIQSMDVGKSGKHMLLVYLNIHPENIKKVDYLFQLNRDPQATYYFKGKKLGYEWVFNAGEVMLKKIQKRFHRIEASLCLTGK